MKAPLAVPLRAALLLAAVAACNAIAASPSSSASPSMSTAAAPPVGKAYGPDAALEFARGYRGDTYTANVQHCYPDAKGVPFADCEHIIPMSGNLWTPKQIVADFQRRMAQLPVSERKRGIVVMLKTERCATKALRACTVTTAALEKRATPLASEFAIYGLLIKPRDKDDPPGSLKIETGLDAYKNDAAGEYQFKQGPGATLVFLDPTDGSLIERTDAMKLSLSEREFLKNEGRTPKLHNKLEEILRKLPPLAGAGD